MLLSTVHGNVCLTMVINYGNDLILK